MRKCAVLMAAWLYSPSNLSSALILHWQQHQTGFLANCISYSLPLLTRVDITRDNQSEKYGSQFLPKLLLPPKTPNRSKFHF